jgi:hypothetical protein
MMAADLAANTVPSSAIPKAYPSWRIMLTAPAAIPARSRGTDAIVEEPSIGETSPTPNPATTYPGRRCGHPAAPRTSATPTRPPIPISVRPAPITRPGRAPCKPRPDTPATTNAVSDNGVLTRPACTGLMRSTDCSQIEA